MPGPSVLTISSHVAAGPVGNSAVVPALLALGVTPVAVSTVLLSNHPGHGKPEGLAIPAETLTAMLNRIGSLRFIGRETVILTGYFANARQVEAVAGFLATHPYTYYLCDPVIGDDGELYVEEDVAAAIRDRLVPLANGLCPNAFELGWLAGSVVTDLDSAKAAAHFPGKDVIVTSVPDGDSLMTAAIKSGHANTIARPYLEGVPHGTGDLLSGLIAGRIAQGMSPQASLESCIAIVERVIAASSGTDVLNLAQGLKNLGYETVIGVDGCPAGWIAVIWGRTLSHMLCPIFKDVLALDGKIIAVDMPIGFPAKHGRSFDSEVRRVLGARRSSVFPVPSRAAVMCEDYRLACSANRENSDPQKSVNKQCFNLFPKMREIDALLRTKPLQHRVFEAHPEVAFWAMNGKKPVRYPKKQHSKPFKPGIALRKKLLTAAGFPLAKLPPLTYLKREVAIDDLIDACACAWVARRILRGDNIRFSGEPKTDQYELRMEINA